MKLLWRLERCPGCKHRMLRGHRQYEWQGFPVTVCPLAPRDAIYFIPPGP